MYRSLNLRIINIAIIAFKIFILQNNVLFCRRCWWWWCLSIRASCRDIIFQALEFSLTKHSSNSSRFSEKWFSPRTKWIRCGFIAHPNSRQGPKKCGWYATARIVKRECSFFPMHQHVDMPFVYKTEIYIKSCDIFSAVHSRAYYDVKRHCADCVSNTTSEIVKLKCINLIVHDKSERWHWHCTM